MILFQLRCSQGHEFEAWFSNNAAWEEQSAAGLVSCPMCGETHVSKAIMAPAVSSSRRRAGNQAHETSVTHKRVIREALVKLKEHVENNAEHVGAKFAEEVRKIHYGETDDRPVYGEATQTERDALEEEGIEVATLPWIDEPEKVN